MFRRKMLSNLLLKKLKLLGFCGYPFSKAFLKAFVRTCLSLCRGASEFKFSLTYARTLIKEDKTIQDCLSKVWVAGFPLSEGKHQNNGGGVQSSKTL